MKIGVFDSGRGGEAVAVRLRELLPDSEVLTAHDSANVPYGSRSEAEVQRLTEAGIRPLLDAGCDTVVLACNTATAAAIEHLRRQIPGIPFVGLEPMVKPAAAMSLSGVIAVCATPATLDSARYAALKDRWAPGVEVVEPDCRDWAASIERDGPESVDLSPLVETVRSSGADAVVLACTHYHWIRDRIEGRLRADLPDRSVTVLEPSDAVAGQVARVLSQSAGRARGAASAERGPVV
ncbi:glutamate racemase [Nesterenkonia sp. NBAIMH1]|uniref:glutamate racemase n=1 Tax=Nesterenkonia sp. NBAIMH1 TaxID=2600320 RepID=UPI00143D92DF|nr:aspartate/glutamate racemase family protein [Nesterenkonia sp. NBAIMH1]